MGRLPLRSPAGNGAPSAPCGPGWGASRPAGVRHWRLGQGAPAGPLRGGLRLLQLTGAGATQPWGPRAQAALWSYCGYFPGAKGGPAWCPVRQWKGKRPQRGRKGTGTGSRFKFLPCCPVTLGRRQPRPRGSRGALEWPDPSGSGCAQVWELQGGGWGSGPILVRERKAVGWEPAKPGGTWGAGEPRGLHRQGPGEAWAGLWCACARVCACACARAGGGGEAPQAGPWPPLPAQMGLTAPGVGAEVVWGPAHKPTALLAPGPGARHTLSHGGCRGPSSGRRNAGGHRPQICRTRPRRLLPETPTPLRDREPDPA